MDDLSAPLGQERAKTRFALPLGLARALVSGAGWATVGALAAFLVAFLLWAVLVDDPYGGEPIVVASTDQRAAPAAKKDDPSVTAPAPDAAAAAAPKPVEAAAPAKTEGGAGQTVTIIDGSSGKREQVQVGSGAGSGAGAGSDAPKATPLIDAKLLETTRHGQIPQIGRDRKSTRLNSSH